ncbi:hypothetical protein ACFHYQ_19935 [Sphaerimonospora cavernae]|uniref:Uncharacterized protein n=1 Tax=Sphaerimonospora cavernae TaxID=1740611 RepID=A0ABV6U8S4_9ACTN
MTTDGWKSAVVTRASNLLGSPLWGELQTMRHSGCVPLAVAARNLLEARDQAHALVAEILVGESPPNRAGRWLWGLLREYAKKIPIPGEQVYEACAHALRIMGIYLCAVTGDLTRCECLADLAETTGKDKLEDVLTAGLDDWADKLAASTLSQKP